ncbi:hypothetical protein EON81_19930 [bacterium]|nr:MAG: hypothetical protein EON81_19930 [bacterium]
MSRGFRVYSNTGHVFYPEPGVAVHPSEPTTVDQLSEAMEFQRVNLRIEEIGEDGQPIDESAGAVTEESARRFAEEHGFALLPQKDRDALSGERDRLATDNTAFVKQVEKLEDDLKKAKADLQTSKDELKDAKANHKTEVDKLKTDYKSELTQTKADHKTEVDRLKSELAEAKKPAQPAL